MFRGREPLQGQLSTGFRQLFIWNIACPNEDTARTSGYEAESTGPWVRVGEIWTVARYQYHRQ